MFTADDIAIMEMIFTGFLGIVCGAILAYAILSSV